MVGECVLGGEDRARSEVGLVELHACGHLRAGTLITGLLILIQEQSFCYWRKQVLLWCCGKEFLGTQMWEGFKQEWQDLLA